jgi:DHA2 family multidrug resistance protein-like MFS transporter
MPLSIVLALLAAAAGSFTFVRRQRRQTYPLIDFSLFRNRSLLAGVIAAALAMAATAGIELLLTQRLQLVLGLTPLHAGLIVTAFAIGSLPVGVLAGGLVHRTGARPLIGGGLLLGALGAGVTLLLTPGVGPLLGGGRSPAWVIPGLVLVGAGLGIVMVAASTAIIGGAPARRAGMASAIESVSYELGSLAGVTVVGTVLTAVYTHTVHLPATAPAQAGGSIDAARAAAGRLPTGQAHTLINAAASAFDHGYTLALAITAIALAAGSAFTYRYLTGQPTAPHSSPPSTPNRPSASRPLAVQCSGQLSPSNPERCSSRMRVSDRRFGGEESSGAPQRSAASSRTSSTEAPARSPKGAGGMVGIPGCGSSSPIAKRERSARSASARSSGDRRFHRV